MSQVSPYLRRGEGFYAHWCPGCEEMHALYDTWTFNGNVDKPSFSPSFKHGGVKRQMANAKWTGDWIRDAQGHPVPFVCHYILTDGILHFCNDSTHPLTGKSVALPELPKETE
jgi:hypothetical protein